MDPFDTDYEDGPEGRDGEPPSGPSCYGGGGGYGGYGAYSGGRARGRPGARLSLGEYSLILRERIWHIVAGFLLVFGSAAAWTYSQTPIYKGVVRVQLFRSDPTVMKAGKVSDAGISSEEDMGTQMMILNSVTIIERVSARMDGEELQRFLAPYAEAGGEPPSIVDILIRNRSVYLQGPSFIISIEFRHPDREMAAKVAGLFADEYINFNVHRQIAQSLEVVAELQHRATEQRRKVEDLAAQLQVYREKGAKVSLDERKDIVTEQLEKLEGLVMRCTAAVQAAETRRRQVLQCRQRGGDLLTLPFIATVPAAARLREQVALLRIKVARLGSRYRAEHPVLLQAADSLHESERQLALAIETAAAQVEAEYQTALQDLAKAQESLAAQVADSLKLDRYGLEYANLQRDYEVNRKILDQILERLREASLSGQMEHQNARILDPATADPRPVSPAYAMNLTLGAVGGLILGLCAAYISGANGDQVRSAYDIETIVGLPLVGIIPGTRRKGASVKPPREAFTMLHASLCLNEAGKKARCILVTSTITGEGKTFIAANLAGSYAEHGERVVIVDCDLRRPALGRAFGLENLKGVIDVCASTASLDEVTAANVRPNLDVILSGGRSRNPTELIDGRTFALMLSELRKRYDRIIIDTPPVATVSDALDIAPMVDGWLYCISFNRVRRDAAQACARRMMETNAPGFGAVLNDLTGGLGGEYHSRYYGRPDKSPERADDEPGSGAAGGSPGDAVRS